MTQHGGARTGAGRPKMSAAEKELNALKDNDSKVVLDFSDGEELPQVPASWLKPKAVEIYNETIRWLKGIGASKGVLPRHVEEYCHLKAKWHECQEQIDAVGMLIKDDGKAKPNPFLAFAKDYQKQANDAWSQIYIVVRDCKSVDGEDGAYFKKENLMSDDSMERMLAAQDFGIDWAENENRYYKSKGLKEPYQTEGNDDD